MRKPLGILKKVPIRDIWKKEPDFSAQLAEDANLALLGQKVGVEILTEETEAGVGDFSADILAKEDGGERLVIIENQYGDTNHDHLGKLITYAAGRGAKVLIWVVEDATGFPVISEKLISIFLACPKKPTKIPNIKKTHLINLNPFL